MDIEPHLFQYPGESEAQVVVYATAKNAAIGLAKMVTEAAAAAIKEKGSFTLVLSGENLARKKQRPAAFCLTSAPLCVCC